MNKYSLQGMHSSFIWDRTHHVFSLMNFIFFCIFKLIEPYLIRTLREIFLSNILNLHSRKKIFGTIYPEKLNLISYENTQTLTKVQLKILILLSEDMILFTYIF